MNAYPNDNNYPVVSFDQPVQSPDVDPDAGDLIYAGFNEAWAQVLCAAIDQLRLPSTWEGSEDDKRLATMRANTLKMLLANATVPSVPAPYWDDEEDVDDQEPGDMQPWYGYVTNPTDPPDELTFQEKASIWAITGFLAFATFEVGFAPAIFFHSIAPKFVIALRRADVGAVVRIIIDAVEYGRVDTSSASEGDIIEYSVSTDGDVGGHDILLVQES